MSSKVTSSTVKGTLVGVGPAGPTSAKRLPKASKKQVMGKTTPSASGERVNNTETESEAGHRFSAIRTRVGGSPGPFGDDPTDFQEDQVIVHVVPPSSPVLEENLTDPEEDEIDYHGHPHPPEDHDPGDPTSASTSTPGGSVLPTDSASRTGDTEEVVNESDQFLDDEEDCSEDCDEDDDEDEEISSEELGEEEEEEEDEDEGDEEDEEAVTDELSEEEATQHPTPRKPLPQHRPQLPIVERTHNNKRRGRTPGSSGLSLGNAASAIKRVRGIAGLRATKCTSTAVGVMGKSKSIVSSLRKNRRAFTSNTNPIFLHNSSSDEEEVEDEEEEEEEEEDDMVSLELTNSILVNQSINP